MPPCGVVNNGRGLDDKLVSQRGCPAYRRAGGAMLERVIGGMSLFQGGGVDLTVRGGKAQV